MLKFSGRRQALIAWIAISASWSVSALAGTDAAASKSLTIQAAGPRQGNAGSNYFNVQGKNKERYAGFGVLIFQLPKGDTLPDVKDVTITMVQSIPSFASDGKLRFYLGQPAGTDSSSLEKLKFDPSAPGGLAKDAFKSLLPLGSGAFKKVETGRVDTFNLPLDDAARKKLHELLRAGSMIHIVVVPDDGDVAATYFGAGNETETNRPRIRIGGDTPK